MSSQLLPYEKAGRLIRLLGWLQIVTFVVAVSASLLEQHEPIPTKDFLWLLLGVIPVVYLTIGQAVKKHTAWGRQAGIVLAALMLLAFPLGTLLGAYILSCLTKGWEQQPA